MALAKGTIDSVVAPIDTLKAMRFAKVVQYCTLLSIARGAYYSRGMNLDSGERLPPDLRAVIEASIPVWSEAVIEELTAAHTSGLKLGEEGNIEFIRFNAADMKRLN